MSDLLDDAINKVRSLPEETQQEVARLMLAYVGGDLPVIQLSPEEEADLVEADAEIERGELASDEEVAAVFAKFKL